VDARLSWIDADRQLPGGASWCANTAVIGVPATGASRLAPLGKNSKGLRAARLWLRSRP
jgi:hypothetical protein